MLDPQWDLLVAAASPARVSADSLTIAKLVANQPRRLVPYVLCVRWHPDIPHVATAKAGELVRVETIEWTGGQIGNNDSAEDIKNVDLTCVRSGLKCWLDYSVYVLVYVSGVRFPPVTTLRLAAGAQPVRANPRRGFGRPGYAGCASCGPAAVTEIIRRMYELNQSCSPNASPVRTRPACYAPQVISSSLRSATSARYPVRHVLLTLALPCRPLSGAFNV